MKYTYLVLLLFLQLPVEAKLNVVTTITDLRSVTQEIGKEWVHVESIARGTQDPHAIEAKPSFMVKLSQADLLIAVGLDLEIGWLPSVIQGSRNPSVRPGQKGYLEVGALVEPLEVIKGNITRADGDVHPFGNPHVTLDPIRMGEIALAIAKKLGELDPTHLQDYIKNAESLALRLKNKTKTWQDRIDKTEVKNIVSFHRTLSYFFNRFKLNNVAILEPKPGIPPTSGHIIEVIKTIKSNHVKLILVENYFDPSVTNKIKNEIPSVRSAVVPVSIEGAPGIKTIDDLYENLVKTIESTQK